MGLAAPSNAGAPPAALPDSTAARTPATLGAGDGPMAGSSDPDGSGVSMLKRERPPADTS